MRYPWGHQRRFNAYAQYFKKTFGGRVQKISIDAGFTCPNRDGTIGTGGCTYCNNDAFNPSYCDPDITVAEQIAEGIKFHTNRYRRAEKYLAYFQPYSNTYASLKELREIYDQALSFPGIIGLVIGTRPDCIDLEKLKYFQELSEKYYIILEYGIESCYDKTLRRINRGHTFQQSIEAIWMSVEFGLKTGAHLIFGLPGESREEMLDEADILSSLPLDTIKFHQLQIVKGTPMAKEYENERNSFNLFSLDEYVDFIVTFTERLNPDIVIERFAGEVPPRFLIAPDWGLIRNDQILDLIEKKLEIMDTWQGKKY
ncbi:MAG: TIGR01212 family radical SAM protein [Bacteroidetes bacterium]|nr:TIGR01212 family radical SAM protein [Bacteroidota bacterium]